MRLVGGSCAFSDEAVRWDVRSVCLLPKSGLSPIRPESVVSKTGETVNTSNSRNGVESCH